MKSTLTLRIRRLTLALAIVVLAPIAMAQTSSVELLGTVTAAQASNGLGFNLDANSEWEWAAAAAAGATYARIQCSWDIIEQQTPPPHNTSANPKYIQAPECVNAFTYAQKYGITPIVTAGYGPPYHQILGVTVPAGAALGATSFTIQFQQGTGGDTLSSLKVPYDYFCPAAINPPVEVPVEVCGSFVAGTQSPEGALIRSVTQVDSTHATITLASALVTPLPADGTLYNISEILYPATATERADDPSVVAYSNYVSFLASDMAARGLKGQIEIWNEPPLAADPWDNSCLLYDPNAAPCPGVPGSAPSRGSPNYGFVANLQQRTVPNGINVTWNGTAGSGWASFLGPRMYAQSGTYAVEPSVTVTEESFHPYGYEPEEMMWTTACLEATVVATTKAGRNFGNCYLSGEPTTSNFAWAVQADMLEKAINPTYGASHEITETGVLPPADGYQIPQARFEIRQFLGFQADGLTPVTYFKLYDDSALTEPNFSFVEEAGSTSSYTTKPNYDSISGFMSDIKPISGAPATAYSPQSLPAVTSYTGTYPLSTVHMVGARSGATANSDAFTVWQRSFVNCTGVACENFPWLTQASPAAAPVSMSIPSTLKLTQLVNLTTRELVSYTTSGNVITFMVADDPVEVLVDPPSDGATSGILTPTQVNLTTNNSTTTYGQQVILTATLNPYKSSSNTTNGETVVFMSGKTQIGTGTLSSGVASLAVASIPAGANTILAEYAGDTHFSSSTGYTSITVATANPTLAIPAIAPVTYGVATFPVTPTTNSPGAVSLSVVSGPAHIATGNSTGGTVTVLGIGTVVLGATQVPTANFNAGALVTTSFVVNPEAVTLAFEGFAAKAYGDAPFPVSAKSVSHGIVTYSIVSGPATVSGATVTLTGAGTVVLQANQPANGNYLPATATLTFNVAKATPSLSIQAIPAQTFGAAPVTLNANSVSSGAITYAVVSGPAAIQANAVSLIGAGTVVLGASQEPSTNYNAGTSPTTSFVVHPGKPVIAFEGFAPKFYGDAPFPVTAKSKSHGLVVLSVIDGPGTISGQLLTILGAGTIVVRAYQPAHDNYTYATATLKIPIAKKTPILSITAIPGMAYGAAPFAVTPVSDSPGAVSLQVVSGPAHVAVGSSTGGTIVLLGTGTVVLGATQVATENYNSAAMVTTSFNVSAELPGLAFRAISAKKYGYAPFPVNARSKSHGSVTYSVVSGPATISGSTVTLTGAGTVVLSAVQQANGNYLEDTATVTFVVGPAS